MKVKLKIWRQKNAESRGSFVNYPFDEVSPEMSFLEMLDALNNKLIEKPLVNRYKGLLTFSYATNLKKWQFDYTIQFNGGGRIPRYPQQIMDNPGAPDEFYNFAPFTIMNAQITKYFRYWNIYIGSENLTNFKQKNPVEGADNPYGPQFDATNVWGPVIGRKIYLGLRFNSNYN